MIREPATSWTVAFNFATFNCSLQFCYFLTRFQRNCLERNENFHNVPIFGCLVIVAVEEFHSSDGSIMLISLVYTDFITHLAYKYKELMLCSVVSLVQPFLTITRFETHIGHLAII